MIASRGTMQAAVCTLPTDSWQSGCACALTLHSHDSLDATKEILSNLTIG